MQSLLNEIIAIYLSVKLLNHIFTNFVTNNAKAMSI